MTMTVTEVGVVVVMEAISAETPTTIPTRTRMAGVKEQTNPLAGSTIVPPVERFHVQPGH